MKLVVIDDDMEPRRPNVTAAALAAAVAGHKCEEGCKHVDEAPPSPVCDEHKDEKPARKRDPNLIVIPPSQRRRGQARHKGESFAEMAMRRGVAVRPGHITVKGTQ